jgi:hypothetical protein
MMASVAAQFRLHHPVDPDTSRGALPTGNICRKSLAWQRRSAAIAKETEMFAVRVTEVSEIYREETVNNFCRQVNQLELMVVS